MNRREFLRRSITVVAGLAVPVAAPELIDPKRLLAARPELRWVFLVDAYKCVGCGFCVRACKIENEVPYDANVTRTWVERYVVTKDGRTLIDSPKGAIDGFTSKKVDIGEGKFQEVKDSDIEKSFFVP